MIGDNPPPYPWSDDRAAPGGRDLAATGWGRGEAQREVYEREQATRVADEAHRAEFAAAFWFMDQQRRKKRG